MELIGCLILILLCFLFSIVVSYIDLYFKIKKYNKKYRGNLSFKKSNYRYMNNQYMDFYLSMFAYDEKLGCSYFEKLKV